jgi:2-dehydropantoate 2-reductase
MNFLIFGAGAIGTYIGGSLVLAGEQAVFLEQPEVAQSLRGRGMRLRIDGTEHVIPAPRLAGSLAEALAGGPFDAAIFALKSNDTQAALDGFTSYAAGNRLPPFFCLQNGVENEPTLEKALGESRVIPGTVTSAIARGGPGDITLERMRGVGLAARHPLSAQLFEALERAGLNPRLYPHPAEMKWSKMLTNLLSNATSAILDMTPAEVFAHQDLYWIEIEQLRETLRVMDAQGIHVTALPGTPVPLLAFAVRSLPFKLSRPLVSRAVGGGRGGKMPSFHIDLHTGRGASEVDYLNGAVVRFGERLGVPTPVNRFLNETLLALVKGETTIDTYAKQPEKLVQELRRSAGRDV